MALYLIPVSKCVFCGMHERLNLVFRSKGVFCTISKNPQDGNTKMIVLCCLRECKKRKNTKCKTPVSKYSVNLYAHANKHTTLQS